MSNLPKRPPMPAPRPTTPATTPPVRPAPPAARPAAPAPRPAAPAPKPAAAPPAPVKPAAAKPATPAAQTQPTQPPRKGGAPTQPTQPPPRAAAPTAPTPAEPSPTRQAGGRAQMRTWLIEFLQTDAEIQDAIRGLFQEEEGTAGEEEAPEDMYAEVRDENGDISPERLMEMSSTMTLEQVNGLPELLGDDGFAYPPEAKGLLARRKYIQKFLSDLQAAQDAQDQGEEEGDTGDDGLEENLWCENTETGQWFYAWPYDQLRPGDTVCFTRDLTPDGEEPGSYGYVWILGTIADEPVVTDKDGDLMLRLNVTADKDNREVLQPLMPEGKTLKIGDATMIAWYPHTPAENQIFQYAGRLEQSPA